MVESKEKQKDRRSSYMYVPAVHVDSPSISYPFQCAAVRLCLESRSTALLTAWFRVSCRTTIIWRFEIEESVELQTISIRKDAH